MFDEAAGATLIDHQAFVVFRLEEAGAACLAMPGSGYSLHVRCSMPEVVRNFWESYGLDATAPASLRGPAPDARKISRMDEAWRWLLLIPQDRYVLRRLVGARSLVHPVTERHIFPWRRLGEHLGADYRAVQRWHTDGINLIVAGLHRAKFNFPS